MLLGKCKIDTLEPIQVIVLCKSLLNIRLYGRTIHINTSSKHRDVTFSEALED